VTIASNGSRRVVACEEMVRRPDGGGPFDYGGGRRRNALLGEVVEKATDWLTTRPRYADQFG
jgi:hypothetical protein